MTKLFYHKIFTLAFILSIFLSGCAAFQSGAPIGALQTLQGMQSVVNGAPGTIALVKDSSVLLGWPYSGNYAFAMVKGTLDMLPCNGQCSETLSFAETVLKLQRAGWQQVSPDKLPPAIIGAVTSYSVELVMLGAQTLPFLWIVPFVPIELPGELEEIIT